MIEVKNLFAALRHDKRGVTAVEYGIMAALIATVLVASIGTFGKALDSAFTTISTHLTTGK